MIKYVYSGVAGVLLAVLIFYAGWFAGKSDIKKDQAQAESKQLQSDAVVSKKIEGDSHARKVEVQTVIVEVEKKLPEWSGRALPDLVLDRLHQSGLYERP